ncbi:Spx/MgsR family RNA polymerase-binding regulatory protein [Hirschia litorea]|uniref:Spx/MgsR family RNA polymerase-binding regulatory protein n=1 Tax=Hirschia litorea TaxID=1199156 RepID=A0ABW2IMY5_9PROT
MLKMTGLKACDTCRKAQKWLQENNIDFEYRDVKKDGVPEDDLKRYVDSLGWEKVINKSSTTWRGLDVSKKENLDPSSAVKLLMENPSLMKRPLFEFENQFLLGFKEEQMKVLQTLA